jgi:hypothetical protein
MLGGETSIVQRTVRQQDRFVSTLQVIRRIIVYFCSDLMSNFWGWILNREEILMEHVKIPIEGALKRLGEIEKKSYASVIPFAQIVHPVIF